jgi:UDP-3-O-[3-hydroxymyristoyl] glucosamine N-acyltransferase
MRLSDLLLEKTEIIRDGNFSSVGTLFSRFPQQVVWAAREGDIRKILMNPSVACVITTQSLVSRLPDRIGIASTQDPRAAFYTLCSGLRLNPDFTLPSFPNRISPSAKIHPSAMIAPASVEIGKDVVIGKNVIVHEQSVLDDGSIIRPNSVIGNSPFFPDALTGSVASPSGGVHLHREVDIHANTRVHRAIFKGYTEIGEQTKIDNLDHVGQGTVIGKRCLICAGVSIGESAVIGDDGWIGPNVTLENQIRVGKNAYITLGSTVTEDIDDDKVVKDNFALDRRRFKKVIRGM